MNIIITLGSERLYSDLSRKFAARTSDPNDVVTVVRIDKSGGCVDRSSEYMRSLRHAQIREYFFGKASAADETLAPSSQTADFSDLHIFRLADEQEGGQYEKIAVDADLKNKILAVTMAGPKDGHAVIRDSSIRGYLYVAEVDEVRKKVRLLSPQPGQTPGTAMVVGSWPEAVEGLVS